MSNVLTMNFWWRRWAMHCTMWCTCITGVQLRSWKKTAWRSVKQEDATHYLHVPVQCCVPCKGDISKANRIGCKGMKEFRLIFLETKKNIKSLDMVFFEDKTHLENWLSRSRGKSGRICQVGGRGVESEWQCFGGRRGGQHWRQNIGQRSNYKSNCYEEIRTWYVKKIATKPLLRL